MRRAKSKERRSTGSSATRAQASSTIGITQESAIAAIQQKHRQPIPSATVPSPNPPATPLSQTQRQGFSSSHSSTPSESSNETRRVVRELSLQMSAASVPYAPLEMPAGAVGSDVLRSFAPLRDGAPGAFQGLTGANGGGDNDDPGERMSSEEGGVASEPERESSSDEDHSEAVGGAAGGGEVDGGNHAPELEDNLHAAIVEEGNAGPRTPWDILDIEETVFKEVRKIAAMASFNEFGPGASRAQQKANQVVMHYLWQAMKIYGCSLSRQENSRRLIEKNVRDRSLDDGVLSSGDVEDRNLIINQLKSYYSTLMNEARKSTCNAIRAYFNTAHGTYLEEFLPNDSNRDRQVWKRPVPSGRVKRDLCPAHSSRKGDYISHISPGDGSSVHDVVKTMRESGDSDMKSAANTFYFLSGEWRALPHPSGCRAWNVRHGSLSACARGLLRA